MTQAVEITPEEVKEKALTVPDRARAIAIKNTDDLLHANDMLLNIKALRKEIASVFDPIIEKAHNAHKEALAQKKKAEEPLVEAEGIIKPRIASYMEEQERIKKAEEERLRQEALKAEEERRLAEAVQLEKEGHKEEAEQVLQEPVIIPPPIVENTTPKLNGTSIRQIWKFRIVNPAKIPHDFMTPDLVKIGGYVRSMKQNAKIPGIEVYPEASVATGRK